MMGKLWEKYRNSMGEYVKTMGKQWKIMRTCVKIMRVWENIGQICTK
jgi:hypothetical protein